MENNTNKSQAEIYREERKERLAKAAAKNAKKSPKISKAKKIVGKVIAIVLAVAVVLGAVGGILNFFGTAEKMISVSTADKTYSFKLGEFNWYYFNIWSNYQSQAYQYDSYMGAGAGLQYTGFDYSKAPDEQDYLEAHAQLTGIPAAQLGAKNPTWADLFKYVTVSQIIEIKYCAQKAAEAGIVVSTEDAQQIDKNVEELRQTAKDNDFSLNRYLRAQFGNGVTEKTVRQILEESILATEYQEKLKNDIENGVADADITAKYNENKNDYDIASLRIYEFTTDDVETAEGATEEEKTAAQEKANAETKAKADAFIASVTDAESFIAQADIDIQAQLAKEEAENKDEDKEEEEDEEKEEIKAEDVTKADNLTYANLESSNEELAKWAFDAARKVGDKTVIDAGNGSYLVVLMTVLPHQDTSVNSNNVRHILVKFPTDDNGKTVELTDKIKAETKAKAQAILDEYLKNPTEENFAKLATEKTEDPGSKETGGLYEDIKKDSQYVEPFLNWSIDPARKAGDTGIVETEYGYHIMYYSSGEGVTWAENIKEEIINEKYNAVFDDVNAKYIANFKLDSVFLNYTLKKENKHIAKTIARNFK